MPKELRFNQQKLNEVNKLIKGGYSEEDAFNRAGITEDEYGLYQIDDVYGSPTRGQVTKAFDTIEVKSKEEEAARQAEDQRRVQEQEAARERRNAEIAVEREKNLERLRQKREDEKAAAKKGWSDEEDKAETTGPASTRGEVTTTTSGGGVRETRMTAEMSDWTEKNRAASRADNAAETQAKNEYLRSKGLENAPFKERNKALQAAYNEGKSFEVNTNRAALGDPPRQQYEDVTIRPNQTNVQVTNDGAQSADQAAKTSAAGQTADAAADNSTPKEIPGEGTIAPAAAAITVAEADKIKNNERNSDKEAEPPNTVTPSPSESNIADPSTQNADKAKQDTIVGATSDSKKSATTNKNDNEKQKELSFKLAKAKTNRLHDYTSSTYRISMYLLSAKDYADLVARPTAFNPQYVLISSGGGFPNPPAYDLMQNLKASGRHPDFQEDFFFEQLSMTTVVGLNAKSKASNAIEISFTIVEPYGMTLLDRLLSACSMPPVNSPNYIDQPYLLEIDFLANVDEAQNPSTIDLSGIRIDRKRFAIKIIEMKIKPGPSGTEYKCRAIPYNHVAFQDTIASVPINLNVQADTVGKFFDSESEISKVFSSDIVENEERIESDLKKWIEINSVNSTSSYTSGFTKPTDAEIQAQRNKIKASLTYTTDSFPAAYNTHMRSISGRDKTFTYPPSLVAINITDQAIRQSKIVDEKNTDSKAVPMTKPTEGVAFSVKKSSLKDGKSVQGFPVSAGTNIVQLIDRVMQSSTYITEQVKEAKAAIARNREIIADRNKRLTDPSGDAEFREQLEREKRDAQAELDRYRFLNWYKIIPQTFLLNFDFSRNAYSKQVVYTIQPYKAANAYHPDFDKTRINKSKIVRSYNYLYTGLNQDITAIDIDFDSSYYTAITAFKDSKTKSSPSFSAVSDTDNVATDINGQSANPTRVTGDGHSFETQGANAAATGQLNKATDEKSYAVADIANSIYTSQRGDMLNVNLRIVGDPAFIKQDDIYYNPTSPDYKEFNTMGAGTEDTIPLNPTTGQIIFDQEQVFVQLIIKSAVDINDETGITNKQIKLTNGRTTDSTFSGAYKVLAVKSEFNRGKFEQTLTLVKMPNDMFFDDTKPANPGVTVITPAVATNQDPAASKPPAPPNEDVAQDATNQSAAETARLKAAAAEPATNPVPAVAGAGSVASAPQPADAAPVNANNAPAVAPQQQTPAEIKTLLNQYTTEYNSLQKERDDTILAFNAKLTKLRSDPTLDAAAKAQAAIALREALVVNLQGFAAKYNQIFQSVFAINTKTTDLFPTWNTLLKRLNTFGASNKQDIIDQTARIATINQTGVA